MYVMLTFGPPPDLEAGREIREEVLSIVESSPEYKAYEKDVDFELSVVRRRYAMGGPVTPARRAQAQAHVAQVQAGIMEEHATKAADAFTQSLSKAEADALIRMFTRLEAGGRGLDPAVGRTVSMGGVMDKLKAKCDALLETINAQFKKDGGEAPATDASKQASAASPPPLPTISAEEAADFAEILRHKSQAAARDVSKPNES